MKSANDLGLTNITFLAHTNRDGVKEIMNVTDAVFVCYRNSPVLSTGSPNKFFDGLAAGKPIIINFGGWIKSEIEKSACGVYVDPAQPQRFGAALPQAVHIHDDGAHSPSSQRSSSMTVRLVLEETMPTASAPDTH